MTEEVERDVRDSFKNWFTGKAKAIFGPAGCITIIGKIAPPKSIELMHERVWNTNLFSVDILARYGLPYVADITRSRSPARSGSPPTPASTCASRARPA